MVQCMKRVLAERKRMQWDKARFESSTTFPSFGTKGNRWGTGPKISWVIMEFRVVET